MINCPGCGGTNYEPLYVEDNDGREGYVTMRAFGEGSVTLYLPVNICSCQDCGAIVNINAGEYD